jgi:hypothetical protein
VALVQGPVQRERELGVEGARGLTGVVGGAAVGGR